MTNRVDDNAEGASRSKGVNDSRVKKMAKEVKKDTEKTKNENIMNENRRKAMYSRDALMPADIFEVIPY